MHIKYLIFWTCFLMTIVAAVCAAEPLDPKQGLFREEWMSIYIDGTRTGYLRNETWRTGDVMRMQTMMRLQIRRGLIELNFDSSTETEETVDGVPLRFRHSIEMAGQALRYDGEVRGDTLVVRTQQFGNAQESYYPWDPRAIMSWGMERIIRTMALEPGSQVHVQLYSPSTRPDEAIPTLIEVLEPALLDPETNDGSDAWTRIRTSMQIGGMSVDSFAWLDANRDVQATKLGLGGMILLMRSVSQEEALRAFVPAELFESKLLALTTVIPDDAQTVRYTLSSSDKAMLPETWPDSFAQRVLDVTAKSAIIEVRRTQFPTNGSMRALDEGGSYRESNAYLNLEDPVLKELADSVFLKGKPVDLFMQADALRSFVSEYIDKPGLQVGFATASEVARDRSGDCSEYAVLLAALGRMHGLPTRVVSGLVYVPVYQDKPNVMGFHLWTQFLINGVWWDFDAAFDESEAAPTRVAIQAASLSEGSIAEMSFSLLRLISGLEISAVIIEPSDASNN